MASKKSAAAEAAVYARRELEQHADELFGVRLEVLQGALHGAAPEAELSVNEVKEMIDQFLNRKVN